ncbi:MAG: serine/threonine-protein phosphatase [Aeriscardovia sp.]|nr:serine/threonine-protein phosphatase [Aeriscardovia sp.]MBO6050045.1 serine/threonine-protein phosphatase [Aeriscardovia sp.]MBO6071664.1 serine/threonine-protein phosphatase [Aeriscardovia sp.]
MSKIDISSAACSDIGLKRADNQDSYLEETGLYLVADGMGGGVKGRQASATCLSVMEKLSNSKVRTKKEIAGCMQEAQEVVGEIGAREGGVAGTTLSGLILKDTDMEEEGNAWYVVNVGDSRTYHLSMGESGLDRSTFEQITHDHSEQQKAVDTGKYLPNQAAKLIPRNLITQAIGSPSPLHPDFYRADLEGRFIICSDGIYTQMNLNRLVNLCSANKSPDEVAHSLVEAAIDGGGSDNATVIVVDVKVSSQEGWLVQKLSEEEDIDFMSDATMENLHVPRE